MSSFSCYLITTNTSMRLKSIGLFFTREIKIDKIVSGKYAKSGFLEKVNSCFYDKGGDVMLLEEFDFDKDAIINPDMVFDKME